MSLQLELARLGVTVNANLSAFQNAMNVVRTELARSNNVHYLQFSLAHAPELLSNLDAVHQMVGMIEARFSALAGVNLSGLIGQLGTLGGALGGLVALTYRFTTINDNLLRLRHTMEMLGQPAEAASEVLKAGKALDDLLGRHRGESGRDMARMMQSGLFNQEQSEEGIKMAAGLARRMGKSFEEALADIQFLQMGELMEKQEGGMSAGMGRHLLLIKRQYAALLGDAKTSGEMMTKLQEGANKGLEALEKDRVTTFSAALVRMSNALIDVYNGLAKVFGPVVTSSLYAVAGGIEAIANVIAGLIGYLQNSAFGKFLVWMLQMAGTVAMTVALTSALVALISFLASTALPAAVAAMGKMILSMATLIARLGVWITRQIVLLALSGPSGWAQLAAGLAVAGAAAYGTYKAMQAMDDKIQGKNKAKVNLAGGGEESHAAVNIRSFSSFREEMLKKAAEAGVGKDPTRIAQDQLSELQRIRENTTPQEPHPGHPDRREAAGARLT